MRLGPLEVIGPVNRIEPRLQKELGPLSVPDDEAAGRQPLLVLRENDVHVLSLEMAESLNNAIRWNDGKVFLHELV